MAARMTPEESLFAQCVDPRRWRFAQVARGAFWAGMRPLRRTTALRVPQAPGWEYIALPQEASPHARWPDTLACIKSQEGVASPPPEVVLPYIL